jgi:hypothetical protein
MKFIRYTGPDIVVSQEHTIEKWRGKTALKSGKVYELDYDWSDTRNLHDSWVFYIFDELNEFDPVRQSRGYEINLK